MTFAEQVAEILDCRPSLAGARPQEATEPAGESRRSLIGPVNGSRNSLYAARNNIMAPRNLTERSDTLNRRLCSTLGEKKVETQGATSQNRGPAQAKTVSKLNSARPLCEVKYISPRKEVKSSVNAARMKSPIGLKTPPSYGGTPIHNMFSTPRRTTVDRRQNRVKLTPARRYTQEARENIRQGLPLPEGNIYEHVDLHAQKAKTSSNAFVAWEDKNQQARETAHDKTPTKSVGDLNQGSLSKSQKKSVRWADVLDEDKKDAVHRELVFGTSVSSVLPIQRIACLFSILSPFSCDY